MKKEIDIKDAEEMAKAMGNFVNNFSLNEKLFCETMTQEHRTLQQSFTRLCVEWFKTLANTQEGRYDLRNEDSVMLAKEIVEKCKDSLYLRMV